MPQVIILVISFIIDESDIPQSKKHVELELDQFRRKLESETNAHKETIRRFNADKKDIITSKEEANIMAIKGQDD